MSYSNVRFGRWIMRNQSIAWQVSPVTNRNASTGILIGRPAKRRSVWSHGNLSIISFLIALILTSLRLLVQWVARWTDDHLGFDDRPPRRVIRPQLHGVWRLFFAGRPLSSFNRSTGRLHHPIQPGVAIQQSLVLHNSWDWRSSSFVELAGNRISV